MEVSSSVGIQPQDVPVGSKCCLPFLRRNIVEVLQQRRFHRLIAGVAFHLSLQRISDGYHTGGRDNRFRYLDAPVADKLL